MLWVYTRRATGPRSADTSHYILHNEDCELVPREPFPDPPVRCGSPDEPEWTWGRVEEALALTIYLDRGGGEELVNEACKLCRPGWTLVLLYDDDPEFVRAFTERGRR